MKKLMFFIGMIMLFAACSEKEELTGNGHDGNGPPANRFYGVKYAEDSVATKGVAQRSKLWYPATFISVKFLNGTPEYQEKVRNYAAEWEQYAGITFDFVTEGEADVRIGFDWKDDRYISWSYIGTDCKKVTDPSEATLSFADWVRATEQEKKGDVLRAFGQVLGLELEHRHLDFDAGWSDLISEYWEGEITDIPWDDLRKYVFDPMQSGRIVATEEYDENSIMIWPFSRRYASNTSRTFNYELSETDKQFIAKVYPKDAEDAFIFEWEVKGGEDLNYFHLSCPNGGTIDWGNGIVEEIIEVDSYTYTTDGTYVVKVTGLIDHMRLVGKPLTKIIQWGNIQMDDWSEVLGNCKLLTSIPELIPSGMHFPHTFDGCSSLKSIPERLFEKVVNTANFDLAFANCSSLTSIPEKLFEKNELATSFGYTFSNCSNLTAIPERLFEKNINATSFLGTFEGCTNLKDIPETLFEKNIEVTNFDVVFSSCINLISIPEKLFEKNVNVIRSSGVFEKCTSLTAIPEELFRNNVKIEDFSSIFSDCTSLTSIPEKLFEKNINVDNFSRVFSYCTSLSAIPEKLFEKNINIKFLSRTFEGCTGLAVIPEKLFEKNGNIIDLKYVFGGCTALTTIPEKLFDQNVNVKDFSDAFSKCTGLTGTTPKTNGIELWERSQYPQYPSSIDLRGCFRDCTGLDNYNDIPYEAK